jgi:hypothetical protein
MGQEGSDTADELSTRGQEWAREEVIQLRAFNQRTCMGKGGSDTSEYIQPEDMYGQGRE